MCAPGSKLWYLFRRRLWQVHLAVLVLLGSYSVLQYFVAYEVQYFVSRETESVTGDVSMPDGPSKLYMSPEVVWEIEGLQDYVAAMAAHDLVERGPLYINTAFDLNAADPLVLAQGLADFMSFMSPSQSHAHKYILQMPLFWGTAHSVAEARLLGNALVNHSLLRIMSTFGGSFELAPDSRLTRPPVLAGAEWLAFENETEVMPPTIHLTTVLPGGAPKQVRKEPDAGWCTTRHRPLKAAQSGYTGDDGKPYCKDCLRDLYPEIHAEKQKLRKKHAGFVRIQNNC